MVRSKARRNRQTSTYRPKGAKTNSCNKNRYETARGAQAAAVLQHDRTGTNLSVYYHEDCLGYHLTSKPRKLPFG